MISLGTPALGCYNSDSEGLSLWLKCDCLTFNHVSEMGLKILLKICGRRVNFCNELVTCLQCMCFTANVIMMQFVVVVINRRA